MFHVEHDHHSLLNHGKNSWDSDSVLDRSSPCKGHDSFQASCYLRWATCLAVFFLGAVLLQKNMGLLEQSAERQCIGCFPWSKRIISVFHSSGLSLGHGFHMQLCIVGTAKSRNREPASGFASPYQLRARTCYSCCPYRFTSTVSISMIGLKTRQYCTVRNLRPLLSVHFDSCRAAQQLSLHLSKPQTLLVLIWKSRACIQKCQTVAIRST